MIKCLAGCSFRNDKICCCECSAEYCIERCDIEGMQFNCNLKCELEVDDVAEEKEEYTTTSDIACTCNHSDSDPVSTDTDNS